MMTYVVAVLCVIGLAIGQILFKASAAALAGGGSIFALKTAAMFLAAMGLYASTSVAWVWVLQKVELGRIYPLMALAFILVPIGSYFVFGERLHPQYFLGLVMIIGGILVIVRS
jgi:drug/metabolite transporter (DMT)-like permease